MPVPNVPTKTALGHDELRLRKHGLGQRYRTILLLIDGRRPLAEVLSLAQQAGSQTSHFEELVRLGMVELPADAAAPEPVITEPGALDALRVTDVEVRVPAPAPAPMTEPPPVVESAAVAVQAPAPLPAPPAPKQAAPAPAPAPIRPKPQPQPPEPVAEPDLLSSSRVEALAQLVGSISTPRTQSTTARKGSAAAGQQSASVPAAKAAATVKVTQPVSPAPPPARPKARRAAPAAPAPAKAKAAAARTPKPAPPPPVPLAPESAESAEDQLIGQVRELLRQTLHYDPPSFGSKLYSRVSNASTLQELVDLAWEFERQPNHPRRSRAGMWTLQHARDLLGLGNTLVQDSWEQDVWEDTRPPADSKG